MNQSNEFPEEKPKPTGLDSENPPANTTSSSPDPSGNLDDQSTGTDGSSSSVGNSSSSSASGKRLNTACTNCRKAHKACTGGRPCQRCLKLGLPQLCKSYERKKRKPSTRRWVDPSFNPDGSIMTEQPSYYQTSPYQPPPQMMMQQMNLQPMFPPQSASSSLPNFNINNNLPPLPYAPQQQLRPVANYYNPSLGMQPSSSTSPQFLNQMQAAEYYGDMSHGIPQQQQQQLQQVPMSNYPHPQMQSYGYMPQAPYYPTTTTTTTGFENPFPVHNQTMQQVPVSSNQTGEQFYNHHPFVQNLTTESMPYDTNSPFGENLKLEAQEVGYLKPEPLNPFTLNPENIASPIKKTQQIGSLNFPLPSFKDLTREIGDPKQQQFSNDNGSSKSMNSHHESSNPFL